MKTKYDVIVIGAGPAGLAAAAQAGDAGLSTLVLDEQAAPGGQIYRGIEATIHKKPDGAKSLGEDYVRGDALVRRFRSASVDYRPGSIVWQVDSKGSVAYSDANGSHVLRSRHIVCATGALERPVPIPGWTLPGVMGAAGAQLLLKTAAVIPDGPVVIAGNGPLLLLVARDLLKAGVNLKALVETTRFSDYLAAARYLPGAFRAFTYLRQGLAMRAAIRSARVPMYTGAEALAVFGAERAEGLRFRIGKRQHGIHAPHVLLHEGVVPNTQITRQLRCEHIWDDVQRYWQPALDEWGQTSIGCFSVAGDGGGINGSRAAELIGQLTGLNVAALLGRITAQERDRRGRSLRRELSSQLAIRPLLDRLFPPHISMSGLSDEVIVCRCEEITAGMVRQAVLDGSRGPNQVKAYTRCGMGPCQGRMCGLTTSEVIAEALDASPEEVGYFSSRPPIKPISLGELAALDLTENSHPSSNSPE